MNTKFVIDTVGVLIEGKLYTSVYGGSNPLYAVKLFKDTKVKGRWGPHATVERDGIKWAVVTPGSLFMFLGVDENDEWALMLFEGQTWKMATDTVIGAAKIFKRLDTNVS